MRKIRNLNAALVTVLTLIIISGVMFSTTTFASSLNGTHHTGTRTSVSEIPKSTLRSARLSAETSVLNKTEAELHNILVTHTLRQVLTQEGLAPKTFREEVRTEMTSYLTSKGFTQAQISAALNSRYIRSHRNNI
jgi:hypothetical protein